MLMNVLKAMIAMEIQPAQTLMVATFVHATRCLQEMVSIARVSEDLEERSVLLCYERLKSKPAMLTVGRIKV